MSKDECSGCKFWLSKYEGLEVEETGNNMGYDDTEIMRLKSAGMCRRYPPVAVTHDADTGFYSFNGDATDFFEFPHTGPDDWCGEFVKKPNAGVTGAELAKRPR